MNILNLIIDLIFPPRCPICHDIVDKTMGIPDILETPDSSGISYIPDILEAPDSSDILPTRKKSNSKPHPAAYQTYNPYKNLICKKCFKKIDFVKEPYCMKCGKPLYDTSEFCNQCKTKNHNFNEGRAAFVYNKEMKQSIYRFKYGGRQEYAKFYAYVLYDKYKGKLKEWKPDVLIPVPVHKSKLKKRGYNQAFLIAKELSKLTKIPVSSNILYRAKKTTVQKNLDLNERSINLKNAFKMRPNKVQYLTAVLIDDIYTTGTTADFCAKTLKDGGFKCVFCLCACIGKGN